VEPETRYLATAPALVGIVRPTLAALRRRLPRVSGVAELAFLELIEAPLLLAEHLELVVALELVWGGGVCGARFRLASSIRARLTPAQQAPQQAHQASLVERAIIDSRLSIEYRML
jgi:hypothetical protein